MGWIMWLFGRFRLRRAIREMEGLGIYYGKIRMYGNPTEEQEERIHRWNNNYTRMKRLQKGVDPFNPPPDVY